MRSYAALVSPVASLSVTTLIQAPPGFRIAPSLSVKLNYTLNELVINIIGQDTKMKVEAVYASDIAEAHLVTGCRQDC